MRKEKLSLRISSSDMKDSRESGKAEATN